MSRLLAALAALLLLAGAARAQDDKKPEETKGTEKPATDLPPETKAAIQREVERLKEDLRDEVRAEIQGAQSAAEFMGTVAEGPKLEFFELDGYYRVRGQLSDDLALGRAPDASGHYLYPVPVFNPDPTAGVRPTRGTIATANMRLRLEPTLNVSELVRVRAQIDVLDNYVLGSSTSKLFDDPYSPFPAQFYGSTRQLYPNDPTADRDPILPKRVWGEVQTPVGLLSFGRMPSEWGLGLLTNAGGGVDEDYGDTVDRIQFALPPVQTPIGALTLVPILDFETEGALRPDPRFGAGVGQPFDADSSDDARTWAVKAARVDTDDEIRRKLDRNESSFNFGAYYNYRTQRDSIPAWAQDGFGAELDPSSSLAVGRRRSYGHVLDLWVRVLTQRWRVEAEAVGVYGHIGQAFTVGPASDTDPTLTVKPVSRVELRQWGGSLVTEYKAIPNKVTLRGEFGAASGDDAPGFGNIPSRFNADGSLPGYGTFEGPQFNGTNDRSIRNFRFNPAYKVDLILFSRILGQVTDAWYVKPKIRWDMFPGLALDAQLVYSQAISAESTPSSTGPGTGTNRLGLEADTMLTYTSGAGFQAYGQYGILEPFGAFGPGELSRAHLLAFGLVAKF
ncbi:MULTISPECIES: TIGR04551 family protein [unclassified Anaeromyxobacter]|uniref:TIGR04551 family protein n=1 Tax=unclassified Anaeromyxobacter TaxID=2620896 RepID=UPI001F59DD40|nr:MULTISPECIES: TIGR04551 family protein [unclassified Anaeromyxobacter]